MRAVQLTVYRIRTIASIPNDPLAVMSTLVTPPSRYPEAVSKIDGVETTAFLTTDLDANAPMIDHTLAVSHLALSKGLNACVDEELVQEGIANTRQRRLDREGPGAVYLIVETVADVVPEPPLTDNDLAVENSERVLTFTATPSFSGLVLQRVSREVESRLLGALSLALDISPWYHEVRRCGYRVADDGRPMFYMTMTGNATGWAGRGVAPGGGPALHARVDALMAQPNIHNELGLIGRAVRDDLDVALDFLTTFTALEQIVKNAVPRGRLRERFESFVHGHRNASTLTTEFDRLYDRRNDLAHEGRLPSGRETADGVRRLLQQVVP